MLQLQVSESVENFRQEFRKWLELNPPKKIEGDTSLDAFVDMGRAWHKKLASGRWVAVHWPEEFGGRGLSLVEEAVVQEELVRVESPQLLGLFGLTMVGPVLIQHGTQAQKESYLAKILSGEEIWCQGFSEPGAGSDLAAIKTKAEKTEGGFLITGQKVWTSFAHIADWCFVLCRTSEHEKKHQGLTYLLVDMKAEGIQTRPLKQISGDEEFNEVFFDNVFVPESNVVGAVGDGWKIAISTLMYERVVLTFARQLQSEVTLRKLISKMSSASDPIRRRELSKNIATACAVRALAYQHLTDYAAGKSPGPEGSLDKLFWSESFQEISKLALKMIGKNAAHNESNSEYGEEVHRYLYSRGRTIAAGTSEIQRSIIAERLLELPRSR
ncbi:MAG: acyl-CoA dehydrogenase family protein [Deltaproteobacteria bacterium]|nr:acyl-CoA dehydrogenase family protein [Deltaproteobacteria bacterium]